MDHTQNSEEPTKCPSCGAELKEGARFCGRCGTTLEKAVCKKCGRELDKGADTCSYCIGEDKSAAAVYDNTEPQIDTAMEPSKCTQCGNLLNPNAKFCGKCGNTFDIPINKDQKSHEAFETNDDEASNPEDSFCNKCGSVLRKGALFCDQCGTAMSEEKKAPSCFNCGAALKQGAKFCSVCGATSQGFKNNAHQRTSRIWMIVAIVGVLALTAALLLIFVLKVFDGSKSGQTTMAKQTQDIGDVINEELPNLSDQLTESSSMLPQVSEQPSEDTEVSGAPMEAQPLLGKIIGIDPGHQQTEDLSEELIGPNSTEAKAKINSGNVGSYTNEPEYELTLAVGLKLKAKLEALGATVIISRTSNDVNMSNKERTELMNANSVDAFIKLGTQKDNKNQDTCGIEIKVPSANSGLSEDLQQRSSDIAYVLMSEMVKSTNANNLGLDPRDDQVSINWSTVPVCLVELGYVSNYNEDFALVSEDYQNELVDGICNGFIQYFQE